MLVMDYLARGLGPEDMVHIILISSSPKFTRPWPTTTTMSRKSTRKSRPSLTNCKQKPERRDRRRFGCG